MKKLQIARRLVTTTLLLCGSTQAAQTQPASSGWHVVYRVQILGSLGGTSSTANSLNDRGWTVGRSNLPGNQSRHATLWRDGQLVDLGTLGGPNSNVLFPVKNTRGIISGISQTNELDPNNETWSCGYFFPGATGTGRKCVGFQWKNGVMTPLDTLGGTHGFATGTNNWGNTVGWAENSVHDASCNPPQVLQFRAVIWGENGHVVKQLPPLPGDTVSSATAINDRGQVVGISGICADAVGGFSAIHNVLWENGRATNIGDLGGVAWNTPAAINFGGDITGFANAPGTVGDDFKPLAFLKLRGQTLRSLGTLAGANGAPNDVTSQSTSINEWRQVVGQSCNADGDCRAFLWQNGTMTDLQTLAEVGAPVLYSANDIDDFGRIAGQAYDPISTQFVAFFATPEYRRY